MTVRESLLSLSPYPISDAFVQSVGEEVGVDLEQDLVDAETKPYYRAKARVYLYLVTAPNISEGGVSISFSASERNYFLGQARRYAELAGETGLVPGPAYGYKGQNI